MVLRNVFDIQRTTRRYIPEDNIAHNYRCEKLKLQGCLEAFYNTRRYFLIRVFKFIYIRFIRKLYIYIYKRITLATATLCIFLSKLVRRYEQKQKIAAKRGSEWHAEKFKVSVDISTA
jgi:hypothetical protein